MKIQAPGGKATPAPPLGPVLGQAGINIGEFVNQFNDQTREQMGEIVPAVINVYDDRSFDFVLKTSPASRMILKAIGAEKGSGKTPNSRAGTITRAQLEEIAEKKMKDLNASSLDAAVKTIIGTCKSMGVEVAE